MDISKFSCFILNDESIFILFVLEEQFGSNDIDPMILWLLHKRPNLGAGEAF
jgi:hypothetical protein